MLSFTECAWDFQNNALWDTHYHALLTAIMYSQFDELYIQMEVPQISVTWEEPTSCM